MTRLLLQDRVLQLSALVYGLTLLVIVVAQTAPAGRTADFQHLVDPTLVATTLVALLWGRARIDRRERRFWDMLALAWICWLLVEVLFFFDLSLPLLSASFTADALYVFFYLVFAVAVDLRPHVDRERSPHVSRRRLESVAGVTALFGVLIYFGIVVLPEPLGVSLSFVPRDRGVTPLLLVRLSLDLVLLGRLVFAAIQSPGRWRRLYGLLAGGLLCFAIKDGLAVLVSEGLLSVTRLGLAYGLFLNMPALFIILAARCRHLPDSFAPGEGGSSDVKRRDEPLRTSPLVLYAVIVPALHFLLYPLGLLEPSSRAPREVFSLFFILVLGLMAWAHQRLVLKDTLETNQALRRAEERLFRSQRLESIGRLAGGIAHDFNNYLTVIRGYCELVGKRLHDPTAHREIGFVDDAADKATHLTRQLLAFGRRQVLRPEALDLNAVVLETGKLLDSLLGEDVTLEIDLDPDLGDARADLGQTEQVLMNLALNGRDAMPRGGTLLVRTRRVRLSEPEAAELDLQAGSYVSLEIADTGCGMTEEVQAQVFEPFFTTKGLGRGTGLGLATVHGIVAQSGGAISLKSAPGAGTTVRVLFPTAGPDSQSDSPSAAPPQAEMSNATLLVVEDDDQVRRLVVSSLADRGFCVHEASSASVALELYREHEPIDMLITDVMMAEMDGVELAERLLSRCAGLRVLFLSGYPAETLRERQAVLPSSIQLLEKPFTGSALAAKIHEVLSAPAPGRTATGAPVGGSKSR